MIDIDKEIQKNHRAVQEINEQILILETKKPILKDCPFKIDFSGRATRIVITNLSQLHEARGFMNRLFESRKYEHRNSFYSCGRAIATFCHATLPWEIWLECALEDFPKELMPSESCKWQESIEKDYHLVCEAK